MGKKIGWLHPRDESDQWNGFNDEGISHFDGNPIPSLAREINQNSLDAADNVHEAVRVTMRLLHPETVTIPNLDELKTTIKLCRVAAEHESDKARLFFDNAIAELAKKKIAVLEICDFNTKGMAGPSTNGTPFYAFTKASGQSKKPGDDATGSFGIGKFAPYAVSKLHTVFVSTVFKDEGGNFQQLTQGKSVLMSHDDNDARRQGTGYWGATERCQPIAGISKEIPPWIQRANSEKELSSSLGTKLTVLAFDNSPGWHESLAVSVAENFFGAISNGKLEVDIDGKFILTKDNIRTFFDSEENKAVAEKAEDDQFAFCSHYLSALHDKTEVIVEASEQKELGLCELRILINETLPKRVCFLRNGMFITDSLAIPGLKSFSDFKEFVAVVECKSKKGIALLRAMEPPRHDNFEPARLPSREEQKRGQKALRELAAWIREMLKRHAKNPVSEVTTLDELKEYFADESGEGGEKGSEEMDPYGKIIIRGKPLKPKLEATTPKPSDEGDTGGDDGGGGGGDGSGGGDGVGGEGGGEGGSGSGSGGAQSKPVASISNIRALGSSGKSRKVFFTPSKSGKIALGVMEAGADADYSIGIESSDIGTVEKGKVLLDVKSNTRVTLNVSLSEEFSGALKVVAHEI